MRGTWVVVVALALTGCTSDNPLSGSERPRADPGQVVKGQLGGDLDAHHSVVVVPGRRYDFTISTPLERIDEYSVDDADVSAEGGDDVRFVTLTWDLEAQLGDVFVTNLAQDVHPILTVVADGADYPVGALDDEGLSAVHVAVPAEADDIGYRVEYDGLVQTVEDAYDLVLARGDGPGALYNEVPRFTYEKCPASRLDRGRPFYAFGAECVARLSSTLPYVGELGWADPGRAWVVAEFSTSPVVAGYESRAGSVDYDTEPANVRLKLETGGDQAADRPRLFALNDDNEAGPQDDGSWSARAIFEVPDTVGHVDLHFRRVIEARPENYDEARAIGAPLRVRRVYAGSV